MFPETNVWRNIHRGQTQSCSNFKHHPVEKGSYSIFPHILNFGTTVLTTFPDDFAPRQTTDGLLI
jgi:hypothetical protein